MRARLFAATALLALAACPSAPPATVKPVRPPGLEAIPARLPFLCVSPGCQEKKTVQIAVVGTRRVAIKRIILTGSGAGDFSIAPSEQPPFIVGGGSTFTIDAEYQPKGAPESGDPRVLITYTDASPDESPDRLMAGELEVPLVRRIVGAPVLVVKPELLSFGVVGVGTQKALSVRASNEGFGNLVLQVGSVDGGAPDFTARLPANASAAPDAGFDVPVTYAPEDAGYSRQVLTLLPTAGEVEPASFIAEATSLSFGRLALEPSTDLDFGLLDRGATRSFTRQLVNQGSVDVVLQPISVTDPSGAVKVIAPAAAAGAITLKPLQRIPLNLAISGANGGEVDATLTFTASGEGGVQSLRVKGTITDPKVQVTPTAIDMGTVPVGWVVTRTVEVKNVGSGPLLLKALTVVGGSSTLFTLSRVPTLPYTLDRDARVTFDVEFRAETAATFNAAVAVETNDKASPFTEVTYKATVGTCQMSCPIANGTPNCMMSGKCSVGTCNAGWHDVDKLSSSGCECADPAPDPGEFCMDSKRLRNLKDTSGDQDNFTGIVHDTSDVDLIRFWAEDGNNVFGDDFDVKISLSSNDPAIQMCVYRSRTTSVQNECFFSEEVCPSGRYYRKDGSLGTSDDAEFIIKVTRLVSSAPSCTPYTVFASNGR